MAQERPLRIEDIQNPEIASLLDPADPREMLQLTGGFATAIGKLSDMGYRMMKGDVLIKSGGVLGWTSPTGDIGYGEEVVNGWQAADETIQYSVEAQVLGRRPKNPSRIRFEMPGFPRSQVKLSSFDKKADFPNLTVTYNVEGMDMAQYEVDLRAVLANGHIFTGIRFWKRSRGFQREITLHFHNNSWKQLDLVQGSLIKLDVYDATNLLAGEINELYRSAGSRDEVRTLLAHTVKQRARSFKEIVKARDVKYEELDAYGDWVKDAQPNKYDALYTILELAGMNQQEIERCILAIQAGSDRVPMPLGQLRATFATRRSTANNEVTRFMPPKLDTTMAGQAGSLSAQWRSHSHRYLKEHFADFLLLENEITAIVFPNITGIRALIRNGVQFIEDDQEE
jgi:hypothetical protein